MKNKKNSLQLPLRFELAYEIIYKSLCFISFGLTFLFATNLMRFNMYSVFFGLLTILLIYLKRSTYVLIEDDYLQLVYLKFFKREEIDLEVVTECYFYENSFLIEFKADDATIGSFYLNDRSKEKLLVWCVDQHPEISALFINRNEKNS